MTHPTEPPEIHSDELLEHALYHVIVGRIERHFNLDPCPAIKAASDLTFGLVSDARKWLESGGAR